MAYAQGRTYCDADSHIMETFDWLTDYADPSIRDEIAPLFLGGAGDQAEKAIAKALRDREDPDRLAELSENVISGPKGWFAYGAFDPAERRKALDDLGFSKQLVFSTFAGTQFMFADDPAVKYGGARAHNRGMAEFCGGDDRLIGVAVVPLDDPEKAAVEVDEAIRLGCGAVWVAAAPAGDRSPGHPDLDPVWARLAEARVPFMLHIGMGTRTLPKAYMANGQPKPKDWLGGGENLRIKDLMVLPYAPQMFLTSMIFDQAFQRHPELRGGVIELGAGWVPDFLRRLDAAQRMFTKSDPMVAALEDAPSDVIRRHMRFTPFPGEDVGHMIRTAGPELFLFSSDFPHPEGGRDPIGRFESSLEGFDEATRTAFYSGNFEHMMGGA